MGIVIGFVLLSGVASPPVALTLLGLYVLSAVMSLLDFQPQQLIESVQRSSIQRNVSPQAREASERARRRGGLGESVLTMLDVGMITMQAGREGMVMRRTRSISKEEDGTRPFVVLHAPASAAERQVQIRFEIRDQDGVVRFVNEMRPFLRDGENNILADHHLPLAGNNELTGAGEWDLQVYVDGSLAGLHSFSMSPSYEERFGRLSAREQAQADAAPRRAERPAGSTRRLEATDGEIPLSLEELLRSQSQQRNDRR